MFEIGDKVVYPGHGLAVVEGIEKKEFSGMAKRFYKLRL